MSASQNPPRNPDDDYVIYMVTFSLDGNGANQSMADRRGGTHKFEKGEHVYDVKFNLTDLPTTAYAYQFHRALPRQGRGRGHFSGGHQTAKDRSQLFSREGKPLGHNPAAQVVEAEKAKARLLLEKILAKKKPRQG